VTTQISTQELSLKSWPQISTQALLRSSDHTDIYAQHYYSVPNKAVPVSIVTGHELEQHYSIPGGGRNFSPSLLQSPDRFEGPTAPGALPSGIKRPESKTHSSVTSLIIQEPIHRALALRSSILRLFFFWRPILIFATSVFIPSHFRFNALWLVY
jgi:hypothetical protein